MTKSSDSQTIAERPEATSLPEPPIGEHSGPQAVQVEPSLAQGDVPPSESELAAGETGSHAAADGQSGFDSQVESGADAPSPPADDDQLNGQTPEGESRDLAGAAAGGERRVRAEPMRPARGRRGRHIPPTTISRGATLARPRSARRESRGGLGSRVLAPAAVLIVAVFVALGVAGVFSSSSHPSAPAAKRAALPPSTPMTPLPAATVPSSRAPAVRPAPTRPVVPSAPTVKRAPSTRPTTTSPTGTTTPLPAAAVPRRSAAPGQRTASAPAKPAPTAQELDTPAAQAPPRAGAPPAGAGGFQPS
jgi:hypothetical protein